MYLINLQIILNRALDSMKIFSNYIFMLYLILLYSFYFSAASFLRNFISRIEFMFYFNLSY